MTEHTPPTGSLETLTLSEDTPDSPFNFNAYVDRLGAFQSLE